MEVWGSVKYSKSLMYVNLGTPQARFSNQMRLSVELSGSVQADPDTHNLDILGLRFIQQCP